MVSLFIMLMCEALSNDVDNLRLRLSHIRRSVCDEALDFMKSHGCPHVMVLESLIVFSVLGIIVNLLKVSSKAVCSRIKSKSDLQVSLYNSSD